MNIRIHNNSIRITEPLTTTRLKELVKQFKALFRAEPLIYIRGTFYDSEDELVFIHNEKPILHIGGRYIEILLDDDTTPSLIDPYAIEADCYYDFRLPVR